MMTNDELAAAISATQERINQTGTACPSHVLHIAHMRILLDLQIARAEAEGFTNDVAADAANPKPKGGEAT